MFKPVLHISTVTRSLIIIAFISLSSICAAEQLAVDTAIAPAPAFQTLLASNGQLNNNIPIPLPTQMASFYQQYVAKQGNELLQMKFWAKPYFDLYDRILSTNGLPIALKYLSVIESHLQPNLVSWAGAVGPWQLMPYEASRFGLKNNAAVDERTDFTKSTIVAAKLLKELYAEFGDWLLVIAAYNGGAGRVKEAIQKAGSNNFWKLQYFLPEETRNHVKKYIATHYLFEQNGGITTLTAAEVQQYLNQTQQRVDIANDSSLCAIEIKGHYNTEVICSYLKIASDYFYRLNPNINNQLATGKKYIMYLPVSKKELFEKAKQQILEQSIQMLLNAKPNF
ncbi:lytic transglycosylase domain-containing protein [Hydrotalea sandarakina]|jgi:membrane-bound lytic murein transglycosylase D|uniref:Membrane-bound lytic murein transglycosylase D n=1 Tax=Hydrotalea sandarakina TaxID=1004304 RepID=A0A2W7RR89_9BACT|nr:lytic transglycosylase domain-containing protein [Hydrotalea sandarakina]PZX61436.1 membrane-bound lytic murein transglycosylase D [Hydrotalea sandarakina]